MNCGRAPTTVKIFRRAMQCSRKTLLEDIAAGTVGEDDISAIAGGAIN